MSDSTHTIFHTAKRFFSGTALSRVAGMMRDMAMAFAFGTQGSVAAFMLAFRFAHLLRRLFGEGAMQSAFVPEFEELRHRSPEKAFSFFRDLYAVLTLSLLALVVVGGGILGAVLAYWDLSDDNRQILYLTMIMLPSLVFICLYGLNASLLQCEKSYFVASVAPVAFNAIWIVGVLFLFDWPINRAMVGLSIGVIVACIGQWLITVPSAWKAYSQGLPAGSLFSIRLLTPELATLGRNLFLGILGVAASQVNNAIDSVFARYAEIEGPAFLWYAIRIQQLPMALFGVALSSALLPPLARAIKKQEWANYDRFMHYALSRTFLMMLPITVAVLFMGDAIINLIYGRGDFDQASVSHTTRCLWGYGIGLLPTSVVLLLAPAFYAQGNYSFPAWGSFLCMVSNCVLNTLFIVGFGWGSVSVAVATSISAFLNMCFLGWGLWIKQGSFISKELLAGIGKVTGVSLIAGAAFYGWRTYWLHDLTIDQLLLGHVPYLPRSFADQCLSFVQQASVLGILFATSLFAVFPFAKKRQKT